MATEAKPVTDVLNEEWVYRSVRDTGECHACDNSGTLLRLGSSAFNDPERRPSVDRAALREGGPQASRQMPADGVVVLIAEEVRAIPTVVTNNKKGELLHTHAIDVVHVPEEFNYAHAVIHTAPHVAGDGAWKKLKEALCRIAAARGWAYSPASTRTDTGQGLQ